MTDPKPRSSFLPIMLLVVGLVIVAGVVLVFVPLVECEACAGVGTLTTDEWNALESSIKLNRDSGELAYSCEWCTGTDRTTLWREMGDARQHNDHNDSLRQTFGVDALHKILKNRQSTR